MKKEFRTFSGAQLRAAAAEKPGAEGHAAVFNQVTDLGWFKEVIKPGAFTRALTEKQDVRCLLNHDDNIVLGRTKSGTLALSEDPTGLAFSCDFPDSPPANALRVSMQRGDIDQCSFAFIVRKQTWTEEKDENGHYLQDTREIEDVDLFDVSIVTYPAYEGATCEPRSAKRAQALWPEGTPEEVRSRMKKKRAAGDDDEEDPCGCDCPECVAGNCDDCSNAECDDPNCRCMRSLRKRVAKLEAHGARTKRMDGEELSADCFLIVGDPADTSTWKLPVKFATDEKTKRHLANNRDRFGQVKRVSQDQRDAAWAKLVSLCNQHGIEIEQPSEQTLDAAEVARLQARARIIEIEAGL